MEISSKVGIRHGLHVASGHWCLRNTRCCSGRSGTERIDLGSKRMIVPADVKIYLRGRP